MEFNYIIITPSEELTSLEKAKLISQELYYISRPKNIKEQDEVSNYLFGWVKGNDTDLYALEVYKDLVITVHSDNDINDLIKYSDSATEEEVVYLSNYIKTSNEITFKNIIPQSTVIYTKQELIDNGFLIE